MTMQDAEHRAPQSALPHCVRLLTGRTGTSLKVEARYVLGDTELRVRISATRRFGMRSWGCVERRIGHEWERVLWVDIAELAAGGLDIENPPADWRAVLADDAHRLVEQVGTALEPSVATV